MTWLLRLLSITLIGALISSCSKERTRLEVTENTEVTDQIIELSGECMEGRDVIVEVAVAGIPAETVKVQALCDGAQIVFTDAGVPANGAESTSSAIGKQTKGVPGCKVSPAVTTSTFTATCSFK